MSQRQQKSTDSPSRLRRTIAICLVLLVLGGAIAPGMAVAQSNESSVLNDSAGNDTAQEPTNDTGDAGDGSGGYTINATDTVTGGDEGTADDSGSSAESSTTQDPAPDAGTDGSAGESTNGSAGDEANESAGNGSGTGTGTGTDSSSGREDTSDQFRGGTTGGGLAENQDGNNRENASRSDPGDRSGAWRGGTTGGGLTENRDGEGRGEGNEGDDENDGCGVMPSPECVFDTTLERLSSLALGAGIYFINEIFNSGLLGTPTPNNSGAYGVFGIPTGDGNFAELYDEIMMPKIYPMVYSLLGVAFLFTGFVLMPFAPISNKSIFVMGGGILAAGAIVLISWNITSLGHHLSHEGTQLLLPSGEDLLVSDDGTKFESRVQLAGGPILAILATYVMGWNIGAMLFAIHGARQALLFMAPVAMTFILPGMFVGPAPTKKICSVLFWQWVGLLVFNWPTAIILDIAQAVNFDFGFGAVGSLTNLSVTWGMFLVAVFLPLAIQSGFFFASVMTIVFKGSVASAAGTYVAGKTGWGRSDKDNRDKRGGDDYPRASENYSKGSNWTASQDYQRRRNAVTDGGRDINRGYDRKSNMGPGTPTPNTGRRSSPELQDKHQSLDQRRRERFARVRGGYNQ